MDFGAGAQVGWIIAVAVLLAAIVYFRRPKDPS
jgi:hypothetical protein